MIQDPGLGCAQVPFTSLEERCRTEDRWGAASSDLPRKCAFCPAVIPGQHPGCGAKRLVHVLVPFPPGDVVLSQQGKSRLFCQQFLVWFWLVKLLSKGVPEVLDFGLDVCCRFADSWGGPWSHLKLNVEFILYSYYPPKKTSVGFSFVTNLIIRHQIQSEISFFLIWLSYKRIFPM